MRLPNGNIPLSNLINLDGKRAIVTGGAMGIGFAISCRLAEAGATVIVADTNAEAAQKTIEELKSYGYKAHFIECDVSREEEVQDMVDFTVKEIGSIDILVNNAGIYPFMPLTQMTGDDFTQVISVNLTGAFLCSREVSRRMIEQKQGGCIINIASIDSVHPSSKGLTAYDASKGGILMLTKSMALELGQHDIRVNDIAPGGILTEGLRSLLSGLSIEQGKAQLKAFMTRMCLGRMGRSDDIGRVVLFLASDLAGYMTGSFIVVDGGYLLS